MTCQHSNNKTCDGHISLAMTSLYFCLYKDIFTLENLTEILKYMQELKGLPTFCYAGAS